MRRGPDLARRIWQVAEPVHAIVYFHPRSLDAWSGAGLRGFWRGYFATRAAPLGPVGPEPVVATFYNFAPSMVARALPEVWSMAPPAAALAARAAGARDALADVLGEEAGARDIREAAEITRTAARVLPLVGRSLFAANVGLPWPDDPLLSLWHGLTLLREHRGDGHNAALTARGIDGVAAHVLATASGGTPRAVTQPARGWTDAEWDAAIDLLAGRRLVDVDGTATDAGAAVHREVERRTDELAGVAFEAVPDDHLDRLVATLGRVSARIAAAGVIPYPNPMGLPAPPAR